MTSQQQQDAICNLEIEQFDILPFDIWSQIPAGLENIEEFLLPLKEELSQNSNQGDVLWVQGDFGATYSMVIFAKNIGIIPMYATTQKESHDIVDGEKITTIRKFEHVRFRKY